MSKLVWLVGIVLLLVGLIAGYFFGQSQGEKNGLEQGYTKGYLQAQLDLQQRAGGETTLPASSGETQQSEAPAVNPFSGSVKAEEINPIQKAKDALNPF